MAFQWNPRTATGTTSIFIIILSWAASLWGSANGITCCDEPDINLTVTCTIGIAQLQWQASKFISFGFMIASECNTNPICNDTEEQPYLKWSETYTGIDNMYAYNLNDSDFDNATCWFWIKSLENEIHCSPIYTCIVEPFNSVSMLPSSTIPADMMPSSSTLFISPSMSTSSPSIFSSPVYLTSYLPTATVTANIIATNINTTTAASATASATDTASTAAAASATDTATASSAAAITSSPISSSAVPSVAPQQSSSPDLYSLLLYITLCCAAIIFLLVSFCFFCCYWRKFKEKQSENYQIEDVSFEDPGELAKESDSETETLTNAGMGDDVSITDDHPYMLRKILRLDHDVLSLDSSILTVNKADDGSVASHYRTDEGGVDCSHYCGSGGQYNTSSSHSSCSSAHDI